MHSVDQRARGAVGRGVAVGAVIWIEVGCCVGLRVGYAVVGCGYDRIAEGIKRGFQRLVAQGSC